MTGAAEPQRLRGFILARAVQREQDLSLKLLLEDGGCLTAVAHNGLASKKRFAAGLSPLALYAFTLTPTRKGHRLDEATVDEPFVPLLTDLFRQTAALAATGLCDEISVPEPGDRELFLLLAEVYGALSREPRERAPALTVRFFLEALHQAGHGIVLDRCVRCDTPVPDTALTTVDPSSGGVVCRRCGGAAFRLSALDRAAVRAVMAGDLGAMRKGLVRVTAALVSGFAPRSADALGHAADIFTM